MRADGDPIVIETLKKMREPAAIVLLAALTLRLLMGGVSLFVLASSDRLDSFTAAARSVAQWITDPFTLVVLAGVIVACVLADRTPRARQLTLAALVITAAGIGLTFLFGLIGLATEGGINRGPNFLVFLAELAIPVLVGLVLLRMLKLQPTPSRPQSLPYGQGQYGQGQYGQDPHQQGQQGQGSGYGSPQHGLPGQAQQNPNQPTWQPDQAAGASWNTAGDAASGAAASGWGTPGASDGWNPTGPIPTGPIPTGPIPGVPYGANQPQQPPAHQQPPAWGAAPYDRGQQGGQSYPTSAASAPTDESGPEPRQDDRRASAPRQDDIPGASAPRQNGDDWWNTGRG